MSSIKSGWFARAIWPHNAMLWKAGEWSPPPHGELSERVPIPDHAAPPEHLDHMTIDPSASAHGTSFSLYDRKNKVNPSSTGGFDGSGLHNSGYGKRIPSFYDTPEGHKWVVKSAVDGNTFEPTWTLGGHGKILPNGMRDDSGGGPDRWGAGYGARCEHACDKIYNFFATKRNNILPMPTYLYDDRTGTRIDGQPYAPGPAYRVTPHLGRDATTGDGVYDTTRDDIQRKGTNGLMVDAFVGAGDLQGSNYMIKPNPSTGEYDGVYRIDNNNALGRRAKGIELYERDSQTGELGWVPGSWHDTTTKDFVDNLRYTGILSKLNRGMYNKGTFIDGQHILDTAKDMVKQYEENPEEFASIFDHMPNKEEHVAAAAHRIGLIRKMIAEYHSQPDLLKEHILNGKPK